jgi:hypothetical protein
MAAVPDIHIRFTFSQPIGEVELHWTVNDKNEQACIVAFPYHWTDVQRALYIERLRVIWPARTIVGVLREYPPLQQATSFTTGADASTTFKMDLSHFTRADILPDGTRIGIMDSNGKTVDYIKIRGKNCRMMTVRNEVTYNTHVRVYAEPPLPLGSLSVEGFNKLFYVVVPELGLVEIGDVIAYETIDDSHGRFVRIIDGF